MSGGNNVRLERGFSISRGVWYPSSSSINYSQWQHIAVTYNEDDISNDPVIYINGVAQSLTEQEDPNGTASSDAAQKIAIGNRVESSSFDGLIDEVIIYNDALTAEQVYQLYLEGINNHTNSTITASETTIGETWTCSVTPNDATEDGTTLNNTLTITDNSAPYINFTDPTPTNGASQTETAVYVNVTTSDDHNHSAFIDWNRSLVAWWSFESYNTTGIYDNSTYSNFGTFQGGLSTSNITTGKYGNALEFDGVNDSIYIEDNEALNPDEITISAWIKAKEAGETQVMSSKGANAGYRLFIYSDGTVIWRDNESDVTSSYNVGSHLNEWIHIVGVGSSTGLSIYINGQLNATGTTPYTGPNVTMELEIGTESVFSEYFNGTIDEVMIWNRALTPEEINASFNAGAYRLYHNFTGLSPGTYEYKAYAIDEAGNVNSTETRNITITYINISLSISSNPALINQNTNFYGHVNDSTGANITNNTVNIYINNTLYYYNNQTALLENTTAWWNTSYAYRTKINKTSLVTTNLNNTIVLVNLSTSSLISQNKMRSDCGDTRFTDNSGNEIQYTLETSTCNTANTIYWIWTNLTGNANNTIYAYYGNPTATTKTDYTVSDPTLILYYHFDNSTAYGENNTRINDFSNKWNDGNCSSCPTWNSTGRYGGAYEYHGNSTSEFFNTGADISWSTTSNYSIGFWMKPRIVTINHGILGKTSTEWRTRLTSAGTFRFTLWNTTGTGGVILDTTNIPANSWTHIFITYNGATGTGTLYRNGAQITTTPMQGEARDYSDNVYIGAAYNIADSGTWYFNGTIDEVRIYNRTLSADEILAHYNSTAPNYIQNHSLPRTDNNGNYNYTFTAPSTAGTYEVKTNTTYNGMSAEATSTLNITHNYINISLSLSPNPALINQNASFYGHVNDSTGANTTTNTVNIYINNTMHYLNNNTGTLETTTT